MPLNTEDIARIARLARLELSSAEGERLCAELNDFFALVEQMQAVDTAGVVPLAHPAEIAHPAALLLAEDQVLESNAREINQRSAPCVQQGLFLVPKVIE